jgi:hypothetical protein
VVSRIFSPRRACAGGGICRAGTANAKPEEAPAAVSSFATSYSPPHHHEKHFVEQVHFAEARPEYCLVGPHN